MRMFQPRRTLCAAVAVLGGVLGLAPPAAANPSLYVYLPTTQKARTLQAELEQAMPGVTVTVFGRIGDLDRALAESRPDAVLALQPVLKTRGLETHLQGVRGDGDDTELYVVLGTTEITPDQLADKVVGTLDLLGRKHMGDFVAVLLGNRATPSVKRVRSTGDLLPLLQFGAADVVVLPEASVTDLTGASQLELKVTRVETARVGLAAVSFLDDADRSSVEAAVNNIPDDTRRHLGVDGWRNP